MTSGGIVLNDNKPHTPFSGNILVSECGWDRIFSELQVLLQQLGFVYFTYSSVPRDLASDDSLFSLSKRRYGVDTQGSLPEEIVTRYYRELAAHDPLWKTLPTAESVLQATLRENTSTPVIDAFWEQEGVGARIYIPVGERSGRPWFNYFGLYHKLPAGEFAAVYRDISGSLLPLLERCHKLLQLDSSRETNPYIRHGVFSETCQKILKMTADGMSVKMIAVKLGLTEEGVTYHITRAKKVLNARNKTQLIARLFESGIM